MTQDLNKNITGIIYNHLNLPLIITFGTGDKIEYFYQADGVKVQKVVTQGTTVTTTDYIDGIQYTNNVLDFIPTAEGYVKNTVVNGTNTYSYVYNYTDHLGNVRLSYTKSPSNVLTILQENNYYPFGMKHSGYNGDGYAFGAVSNSLALVANGMQSYQYKFQGQERQDELGLNVYDYGFRNYMPDVGRWDNMDSKTEAYYPISPYQYVLNNPVVNVDVKGQWTVTRHYNMTYNSLSAAGIGKAQANLLAHYASVYADNPGSHIKANNAAHPTDMKHYSPYVDYSGTAKSQVTDYKGSGYNYNIWHSMRSPWEEENSIISASKATDRGMEFGWDKIFESAKSGKLNSLKNNTDGLRAFGQGVHALQDAYAHHGRSDVGAGHLFNDRYGDTSGAERITDSAVIVHNLMSGNYDAFNGKEDIKFDVGHMSKDQMGQLISAIKKYIKQNREKEKK